MPLPKKLKIGGMAYKLTAYKKNKKLPRYGYCDVYYNEEIGYVSELGEQLAATTIWHEVMHAIVALAGIQLHENDEIEEAFIRTLEPHFYAFIVDNKEFIKHIWRVSK